MQESTLKVWGSRHSRGNPHQEAGEVFRPSQEVWVRPDELRQDVYMWQYRLENAITSRARAHN